MFPVFLIQLVVTLVVVGLLLWVLQQVPMDPAIAKIIRVVVVACVVIWLLYVLMEVLGAGSVPVLRRG